MPLVISEADGSIIYKSLSLGENEARRIVLAALPEKEEGFVSLDGHNILIKKKLFGGRNRLFFVDIDEDFVEEQSDGLLSGDAKKSFVSLGSLTRIFAGVCEKQKGISISVRNMAKEFYANMPLAVVITCLSLMVRFFSVKGAAVSLEAVKRDKGVTFYADGSLGSAKDSAVLIDMLYELAYANGIGVEVWENGGRITLSLELSPTDISEYGFKAADQDFTERLCEVCLDLVL